MTAAGKGYSDDPILGKEGSRAMGSERNNEMSLAVSAENMRRTEPPSESCSLHTSRRRFPSTAMAVYVSSRFSRVTGIPPMTIP